MSINEVCSSVQHVLGAQMNVNGSSSGHHLFTEAILAPDGVVLAEPFFEY